MAFDRQEGLALERLCLRPELSAFESHLRGRMDQAARAQDDRWTRPRAIDRLDPAGGLTVTSDLPAGSRLSDLLEQLAVCPRDESAAPTLDVAVGFLLDVLPALDALHASARMVHGALDAGRVLLTPDGHAVLLDPIYAQAIQRLSLSPVRLWTQFRIAVPQGTRRFVADAAGDVRQAALCALSIGVGRLLPDEEALADLAPAVSELHEIAQLRGTGEFALALHRFFTRALSLSAVAPFTTADEALFTLGDIVHAELGDGSCRSALAAFVREMTEADLSQVAWPPKRRPAIAARPNPVVVSAPAAPHPDVPIGVPARDHDARTATPPVPPAPSRAPAEPPARAEGDTPGREAEVPLALVARDWETAVPPTTVAPAASTFAEEEREAPGRDAVVLPFARTPSAAAPAPPPEHTETPTVRAGSGAAEPATATHTPQAMPAPGPLHAYEPVPPPLIHQVGAPPATERAIAADEWEARVPASATAGSNPIAAVRPADPGTDETDAKPSKRKRQRGPKGKRDKLRSAGVARRTEPDVSRPAAEPTPPVTPRFPLYGPPPSPIQGGVPPQRQPAPESAPPVTAVRGAPALAAAAAAALQATAPVHPVRPVIPAMPAPPPAPVPLTLKPQAPLPGPIPHRTFEPESGPAYVPERRGRAPQPVAAWKVAAAAIAVLVTAGYLARGYLPDPPRLASAVPATPAPVATTNLGGLTGTLELTSQPSGVTVVLDGQPAGETPLKLEGLAAGRHTVSLTAGTSTVKRVVKVQAGRTTTLDIPVYSGWLAVFSPVQLTIYENGRVIGTTEQERVMLPPGRHVLTLRNRQYGFNEVQTLDIEPGQELTLNVQPQGTINMNATPWAEVWVDGNRVGETPIANLPLPVGTHEIVFKNPQMGERKVTAVILASQPASVSIDFSK